MRREALVKGCLPRSWVQWPLNSWTFNSQTLVQNVFAWEISTLIATRVNPFISSALFVLEKLREFKAFDCKPHTHTHTLPVSQCHYLLVTRNFPGEQRGRELVQIATEGLNYSPVVRWIWWMGHAVSFPVSDKLGWNWAGLSSVGGPGGPGGPRRSPFRVNRKHPAAPLFRMGSGHVMGNAVLHSDFQALKNFFSFWSLLSYSPCWPCTPCGMRVTLWFSGLLASPHTFYVLGVEPGSSGMIGKHSVLSPRLSIITLYNIIPNTN